MGGGQLVLVKGLAIGGLVALKARPYQGRLADLR